MNGPRLQAATLDREACGLTARKNDARGDRAEREHVVPASWPGQTPRLAGS